MTCEKRAQVKGTSEIQKGTRHKWGTSHGFSLCPYNLLFSFVFYTKGHKAQKKMGGQPQIKKEGKMAQKQVKRAKYKKYSQSRENLCLVPFALSGAMA